MLILFGLYPGNFPAKIKKKNAHVILFVIKYQLDSGTLPFHTHKIDSFRVKEQLLTPSELGDTISLSPLTWIIHICPCKFI